MRNYKAIIENIHLTDEQRQAANLLLENAGYSLDIINTYIDLTVEKIVRADVKNVGLLKLPTIDMFSSITAAYPQHEVNNKRTRKNKSRSRWVFAICIDGEWIDKTITIHYSDKLINILSFINTNRDKIVDFYLDNINLLPDYHYNMRMDDIILKCNGCLVALYYREVE